MQNDAIMRRALTRASRTSRSRRNDLRSKTSRPSAPAIPLNSALDGTRENELSAAISMDYCGHREARCSQTGPCQVVPLGSRIRPR